MLFIRSCGAGIIIPNNELIAIYEEAYEGDENGNRITENYLGDDFYLWCDITFETPTLKAIFKKVVNNDGWCTAILDFLQDKIEKEELTVLNLDSLIKRREDYLEFNYQEFQFIKK